ncbi:MAG: AMMECR1 domain-containing protein [Acidobacteria bacterium]|nr:MAG: AMMECR1 domain-containing protein [Acidobacteriota bacterium]
MSPLSESEQLQLLESARQALEAGVRGSERMLDGAPAGSLSECRGAFVTLHKHGRLRGCVGFIEALTPLYQTVRDCAVAAALRDPRFEPVRPHELAELRLEISVLSPLVDILPEEIDVGRHGLLISEGAWRGLLLPQVALEWNWDREQFLRATCEKAGLPAEAWRRGARIQAFTAQVFGEGVREPRALRSAS